MEQCWVCKKDIVRTEEHHLLGIKFSNYKIPLCLNCHDLVDRQLLEDFPATFIIELSKFVEDEKYYYLKLFMLKLAKMFVELKTKGIKKELNK